MDTTKTVIGTDWEEITIVGTHFRLQNITGRAEVEVIVKDAQVTPDAADKGSPLQRGRIAEFFNETRYLYVRATKANTSIVTW